MEPARVRYQAPEASGSSVIESEERSGQSHQDDEHPAISPQGDARMSDKDLVLEPKGYKTLGLSDGRTMECHTVGGKYYTITMRDGAGFLWSRGFRTLEEATAEWDVWKNE